MAFSPPNRIKRLHINSSCPEKDAGLAFQNTQVYRKAGYSVGTEVRVVGVGSVLVLASQQVEDGLLLELISVLSASGRDGLGESVSTKVRSSGDKGMQITITGPARSIDLNKGQKIVPRNFGRNSGLIVLIQEDVDAGPIKKAVSMIFEE